MSVNVSVYNHCMLYGHITTFQMYWTSVDHNIDRYLLYMIHGNLVNIAINYVCGQYAVVNERSIHNDVSMVCIYMYSMCIFTAIYVSILKLLF